MPLCAFVEFLISSPEARLCIGVLHLSLGPVRRRTRLHIFDSIICPGNEFVAHRRVKAGAAELKIDAAAGPRSGEIALNPCRPTMGTSLTGFPAVIPNDYFTIFFRLDKPYLLLVGEGKIDLV
jgi:hypothetical protein